MTILSHTLGFPRIGLNRELKRALEAYWAGNSTIEQLLAVGKALRLKHWQQQHAAGIDLLPTGDFAWYDHVLTTSLLVGNIPSRHRNRAGHVDIDTLFRIARGCAPTGTPAPAAEMTKWFNTNYHYIVPEFSRGQHFELTWTQLLDETAEALALGYRVKPILLGPLSYLWLGKAKGETFDKLTLIDALLPVYQLILDKLAARGVTWVQIDEPALGLDLPTAWRAAYQAVFHALAGRVNLLLTTYFGGISHQLDIIGTLPVQGLHIDVVQGDDDIAHVMQRIPAEWVLSVGVINGRNVWRADLTSIYQRIAPLLGQRQQLWVGSSCSLLHAPVDVHAETTLDAETKSWLSFALQKCEELALLRCALTSQNTDALDAWSQPIRARATNPRIHNAAVAQRVAAIGPEQSQRSQPFETRAKRQQERLRLPRWPTTTIGSFPQTQAIRKLRLDYKFGRIAQAQYNQGIAEHIRQAITEQELLGLDVLVHGEAERNDMVEYFGERLTGFIFTAQGWVQSYGSRCVKPPIIVGDVSRSQPLTLEWTQFAQSLTDKPVKGMLTGPVTILCWSFPREDIPRDIIAKQIALALRDEVETLQQAGIKVIQIDEPALREGLPLRAAKWAACLAWEVEAFRLAAGVAEDTTQIHTHMCYCEFNDIIATIAQLDADVITIETARSDMELLEVFKKFDYPNAIGPGVYDIHSPNIPATASIEALLTKAAQAIDQKRLWVNPDCGLKTRNWQEVRLALANMVQAARHLRAQASA